MKTRHKINTVLLAVTVLVLLPITIAFADNIYVSDYHNGNIYKFDSSGNMSTFASGLDGPEGLAFDRNSNLYVACWAGTIEKFDSSGNKSTFVSGLKMPGSNSGPVAIAFDNSGNLYTTNFDDGTILKFDSSGNKSTFASGINSSSDSLAFDSSGYLYVADKKMGSRGMIEKFDSSGNKTIFAPVLATFTSLAFDSSGNLYVANWYTGTIDKFDSSGNRSLFASGLHYTACIATQIPEPASALLIGAGFFFARLRCRQS